MLARPSWILGVSGQAPAHPPLQQPAFNFSMVLFSIFPLEISKLELSVVC